MTKIGVLSDTHLRDYQPELGQRLAQVFQGVDMILHAGDLVNLRVLDLLDAPQVRAVCGNMDDSTVAMTLPRKLVVEIEGFKIGLIHGWGSPVGLAGRVAGEFTGVDCIVFGHSHRPMNARQGGVLMFNPGSVGKGFIGSGTVGLLTVEQALSGQIIKL
ncbi:MAG: metallophosphoesterase family protein [Pseudomonadota bacterium]